MTLLISIFESVPNSEPKVVTSVFILEASGFYVDSFISQGGREVHCCAQARSVCSCQGDMKPPYRTQVSLSC